MAEERARVLEMLAKGTISAQEAAKLLDALEANGVGAGAQASAAVAPQAPPSKGPVRFLRVTVKSQAGDDVNVRIPLGLLRAGMKLTSLIPREAMQKLSTRMSDSGVPLDLAALKQGDIEPLIESLGEMEVSVDSSNGDMVRVFCE
jgi:hypothetical protein